MRQISKNDRVYLPKSFSSEAQYEAVVLSEFRKKLLDFHVLPFKKEIQGVNGTRNIPDLAIVAKDLSCWFVVEVELAHHSLNSHVIPQVTTFVEGEYSDIHAQYLNSRLELDCYESLFSLVRYQRPIVLVVVDSSSVYQSDWHKELRSIGVKMAILEAYFNELDDCIVLHDGYHPVKPASESIKLVKHQTLNSLYCKTPPPILRDMHSASLQANYGGTMHGLKVLCTESEAMLFLSPDPNLEEGKQYLLEVTSITDIRIIKREHRRRGNLNG